MALHSNAQTAVSGWSKARQPDTTFLLCLLTAVASIAIINYHCISLHANMRPSACCIGGSIYIDPCLIDTQMWIEEMASYHSKTSSGTVDTWILLSKDFSCVTLLILYAKGEDYKECLGFQCYILGVLCFVIFNVIINSTSKPQHLIICYPWSTHFDILKIIKH